MRMNSNSGNDTTPTLGEVASSIPFINSATHDSGDSGSGCESDKK